MLFGLCVILGLSRGGLNNVGGLFMVPVTEDMGFGSGEFMLYYSISSLVTVLFLPFAGKMVAKYDIRILLIVGTVFHAGSFASFGFVYNIWGWYLLSIPMAMGSVFSTQIAGPILIDSWFKKHSGLAIGSMMAAVGLFGAIMQLMTSELISGYGWRCAYIVVGAFVMIFSIPMVLCTIYKHPEEMCLKPLGIENERKIEKLNNATNGLSLNVARKSVGFYLLLLFLFFATAAAAFAQHIPQYANQLGFDTAFSGAAMSSFMIGAFIGALTLGFLSDRQGPKTAALIAISLWIAATAVAILFGKNTILFRAAFCVFGVASASIGTLGPLLISDIFGKKEYAAIYSIIAMGMPFAGIVALPGYGFIYDATHSYVPVLWLICAMLLICVVCILLAFAGKKKMEMGRNDYGAC